MLRRYVLALLIEIAHESRLNAARVVTGFAEAAFAVGKVPVVVRLERTGNGMCLRIEMESPILLTISPEDRRVLDQLTTGHGVSHGPDGVTTWAEVALLPLDARSRNSSPDWTGTRDEGRFRRP